MTAHHSKKGPSAEHYATLLDACEYGKTALIESMLHEYPEMLRHGPDDIHPQNLPENLQGTTLLICAVQWAQTEAVALLLRHGIDTAHRDRQGRTAADWADAIPYASIGAMIREEDARRVQAEERRENAQQIMLFAAQFTEGLENPIKLGGKPLRFKR